MINQTNIRFHIMVSFCLQIPVGFKFSSVKHTSIHIYSMHNNYKLLLRPNKIDFFLKKEEKRKIQIDLSHE